MKIAKKNTIVFVRAFEGYPLVRCTLKGIYKSTHWFDHGQEWYVIKPLETLHGYYKNHLDTCREIIPAACVKWSNHSFRWRYAPFEVDENLPVLDDF